MLTEMADKVDILQLVVKETASSARSHGSLPHAWRWRASDNLMSAGYVESVHAF